MLCIIDGEVCKKGRHNFKFLKKTFFNFGNTASNTACSAGTAALCVEKVDKKGLHGLQILDTNN